MNTGDLWAFEYRPTDFEAPLALYFFDVEELATGTLNFEEGVVGV